MLCFTEANPSDKIFMGKYLWDLWKKITKLPQYALYNIIHVYTHIYICMIYYNISYAILPKYKPMRKSVAGLYLVSLPVN